MSTTTSVIASAARQSSAFIFDSKRLPRYARNDSVLLGFLFLVLIPFSVLAEETTEDHLVSLLQNLSGLTGHFEQTVQNSSGELLQRASGELSLLRPNRFRWDYTEPYKQQIVSDGERVWFYDEDLEQVTVRELDDTIQGSPAGLLAGSDDVYSNFTIEEEEVSDLLLWIRLIPKSADSGFESIRMGFHKNELVRLFLVDDFGQVTRIHFTGLLKNSDLSQEQFNFTPPDGVDVLGNL